MTNLLQDRYKIGLFLAALFLTGAIASLYAVYSLPNSLNLNGYHPALNKVFIWLGITFTLGTITIWYTLNQKNEVIVFRDKTIQDANNENNTTGSGQTTISLESVKANLNQSKQQKDILQSGLQAVCKQLEAGQGAIYMVLENDGRKQIELKGGYALAIGESTVIAYEIGEGLIGQAAANGRTLYIDDVPEGYVKVVSGLGSASPRFLLIVPIKNNENVLGILEIASFKGISSDERSFVEESAQLIATQLMKKA